MATKPESYPFLRIAKRYGVDYGHVLEFADYVQYDIEFVSSGMWKSVKGWKLQVLRACVEFGRIRNGHIDWLTGEPT